MARDIATITKKLERLAVGAPPRVLELCSGCGGLSLGLRTAGFELTAHAETNSDANTTYATNFGPADRDAREPWSRQRDMISLSTVSLLRDFSLRGSASAAFDILAAGLPCQAFARIGRSKLRSLTGDEHAYRNDPRASLYRRFLEIVEETRPVAIVLENVPDIMNFGGHNVPEEISQALDSLGYCVRYTLMNAAFYGVPQLRERLFLIAVDESLGVGPLFPQPTHFMELPRGYESTRSCALKYVKSTGSHFAPIREASKELPASVTTREALRDLPFLSDHLRDPAASRARKLSDKLPYRESDGLSDFAVAMRAWSGFETAVDVDSNVVRHTERDFPIFGRMPRGGDYPVAVRIARELLEEKLSRLRPRPARGSYRYRKIAKKTVPPYDVNKFPNKWWKLNPELPSRTLTAHLGKDTYSHIHFDGRQRRMISVREAARLQSFPDGFRFPGSMNSSLRQIGNAVPPLMAVAIGDALMEILAQAIAKHLATQRRVA
jgi:DNA (cytosine-5)-methyltransferase 1